MSVVVPLVTAAIAAIGSYAGDRAKASAAKKAAAAGAIPQGGGSTPPVVGGEIPGSGKSLRELMAFDEPRRVQGTNAGPVPQPMAKSLSGGEPPPAEKPMIGPQQQQIPQSGRTFKDLYDQAPGPQDNNVAGGYGADMTMPKTQMIGPEQQAPPTTPYGDYAKLAAGVGSLFQRPTLPSAGIPHPGGGNYTPTAGQFARRPTY